MAIAGLYPSFRVAWDITQKKYVAYANVWPWIMAYHRKPNKAVKLLRKSLQQEGLLDQQGRIA